MSISTLPITPHLATIVQQIQRAPVTLIEATPGSGKTTLVPLELLKHYSGKILVLEPRRLATKMAAARVASLLGEKSGETVGHIYRFERAVGDQTRLIFLTEGTFLHYLRDNPGLEGVDVVVMDEFHERHLATDLAWGLFQKLLAPRPRPPRLVIMSATLDESVLRRHCPTLEKIVITAPIHPLEIVYPPRDGEWAKRPLERKVLWGIQEAWKHAGDILVFLPGLGEIKRVEETLRQRVKEEDALILTLHGQESSPEALIMRPQERRKIILSSNVAESSLTIPGVAVVVDAGLQREAVFDRWSGISELVTGPCSQASSIQRAGRAARTGPGTCLRLFSEAEFQARPPYSTPEILKTDLSQVLLELGPWKISPNQFPWVKAPLAEEIAHAEALLTGLGAWENNAPTALGLRMAQLPLPPRAARVLVEAQDRGTAEALRETIRLVAFWVERGDEARRLKERLRHVSRARGNEEHAELFFLKGLPERIARVRGDDAVTAGGETWRLGPEVKRHWDARQGLGLVLEVNGLGKFVTKLVPLEAKWVHPLGQWEESTFFDETRQRMVKRSTLKLGALTLETKDEALQAHESSGDALTQAARLWLREFQESETAVRWGWMELIFYPDKPLKDFEWELFLEEFLLEPAAPTEETRREFERRLQEELQLYFDPSFTRRLNQEFPKSIALHPKRTCDIHYEAGKPPWIETFIQDFYGRKAAPSVAGGKLPLLLRLTGPHRRAEQITADLAGFWKNTYPALAKELKRDYPRHFWPEDPSTAEPRQYDKPRPGR